LTIADCGLKTLRARVFSSQSAIRNPQSEIRNPKST